MTQAPDLVIHWLRRRRPFEVGRRDTDQDRERLGRYAVQIETGNVKPSCSSAIRRVFISVAGPPDRAAFLTWLETVRSSRTSVELEPKPRAAAADEAAEMFCTRRAGLFCASALFAAIWSLIRLMGRCMGTERSGRGVSLERPVQQASRRWRQFRFRRKARFVVAWTLRIIPMSHLSLDSSSILTSFDNEHAVHASKLTLVAFRE